MLFSTTAPGSTAYTQPSIMTLIDSTVFLAVEGFPVDFLESAGYHGMVLHVSVEKYTDKDVGYSIQYKELCLPMCESDIYVFSLFIIVSPLVLCFL